MTNETIKNIMDRRSIRDFKAEPLTQAMLDVLRDAALASPSGMNKQPWQFHFITKPAVIERISQAAMAAFRLDGNQEIVDRIAARHASLFYGAPLLIIITAPADGLAALDVGIATQTIVLAAQSLGLGSCIIGLADAAFSGEDAEELAEMIKIPAGNEFSISIAVGHPATTKDAHDIRPEKITWIR